MPLNRNKTGNTENMRKDESGHHHCAAVQENVRGAKKITFSPSKMELIQAHPVGCKGKTETDLGK